MSVAMLSDIGRRKPEQRRWQPLLLRPVVGVLADGTAFYVPLGEVTTEDARVICHLCGRPFRSVTSHLRAHAWSKQRYCETFGLERHQSLEGPETRRLRSMTFTARLVDDPAIRAGSAAGRARARAGELTKDAATAARGRKFPEQRRRKNARARVASTVNGQSRAHRDSADRYLAATAADAARRLGYPDIGALVADRTHRGFSLAAISREAGLHKDWLSRHLDRVDAAAALTARQFRDLRPDSAWMPRLLRLGFDDVSSYLADRHLARHDTVHAIAAEIGMSHHAVRRALDRHNIARTAHSSKRHAAAQRAADVAERLGYPTVASYIDQRRREGWAWSAISAESGQPLIWLRRQGQCRPVPSA